MDDLDLILPVDVTLNADVPEAAGWSALIPLGEAVATAVADVLAAQRHPVVLSGDCTTALGIVAGLQRAGLDPAIIWFDAHGDVQTMETTTSGFLGGMPLRLLVGYRPELMATPLGLRAIPEERVLLVGARDLDPPEEVYLRQAEIRQVAVEDLQAEALPDRPLYVHLDFDVVDPADLPGLRYPASGGPGLAAVMDALQRTLATGRVAAVGIACTWYQGIVVGDEVRALLEPIMTGWERLANRRS
jgi:arginase